VITQLKPSIRAFGSQCHHTVEFKRGKNKIR
jgi:hypothetical protein